MVSPMVLCISSFCGGLEPTKGKGYLYIFRLALYGWYLTRLLAYVALCWFVWPRFSSLVKGSLQGNGLVERFLCGTLVAKRSWSARRGSIIRCAGLYVSMG